MEKGSYNYKVAMRLITCKSCPSVKHTKGVGMTCGKFLSPTENTCGCIISVKARIMAFHCPQKKW
jgi:hypothetical protein